jgi:hypothetical protein
MRLYKALDRYLSIKRDLNSVTDKFHAEEEYEAQLNVLKEDLKARFTEQIEIETNHKAEDSAQVAAEDALEERKK